MAHLLKNGLAGNPSAPETLDLPAEHELVRYIDLKLAALGHSTSRHAGSEFFEMAGPLRPLLRNYHQKDLML
jgi:hypothetical protein